MPPFHSETDQNTQCGGFCEGICKVYSPRSWNAAEDNLHTFPSGFLTHERLSASLAMQGRTALRWLQW